MSTSGLLEHKYANLEGVDGNVPPHVPGFYHEGMVCWRNLNTRLVHPEQ